jgi:hypothetical protein
MFLVSGTPVPGARTEGKLWLIIIYRKGAKDTKNNMSFSINLKTAFEPPRRQGRQGNQNAMPAAHLTHRVRRFWL